MQLTKTKQFIILLVTLIIISSILYFFFRNNVDLASKPITIGLYSKNDDDYNLTNFKSKHIFTVWGKEYEDNSNKYYEIFKKEY